MKTACHDKNIDFWENLIKAVGILSENLFVKKLSSINAKSEVEKIQRWGILWAKLKVWALWDTIRLPDSQNLLSGVKILHVSFTGTQLYRSEVYFGRNANFKLFGLLVAMTTRGGQR